MREIIFGDIYQYKAREDGAIFTRIIRGSHTRKLSENWTQMKPHKLPHGYRYLSLHGRKKKKTYVHRIIAELFIGNPPCEKMDINHKNCIKDDNRVENLEWVTRKQNIDHAKINGLLRPPRGQSLDHVIIVRDLLEDGLRPIDIARLTEIPPHAVYRIKSGKYYSEYL